MVGLYKDPDGKDITFKTTTQKDIPIVHTDTRGNGEMIELRQRVVELENTLLQCVSNDCHSSSNMMVYW